MKQPEEEEDIYTCSSRLGLIKMDHHHSGNGRNSQQHDEEAARALPHHDPN
jgi:hypothetical protein